MYAKTGILITLALATSLFAEHSEAGKMSYDKACKSCHGADGTANPAMAKALKVEMRHLGSSEVQAQSDAEWKAAITDGKGKMKPVKSVSGAATNDVIAFMRTLKK
ncbi:MAG: c-type cytochrome [Bryobacteraceae bacterium]|nr:c-type cytochrome [Bryobacteraceae bacterium]